MCGFLRLFRIHLFFILTQFEQNLYSIFWEKSKKPPKMTRFGTFWTIKKSFWPAIFCKWSEIILSAFWSSFSQIGRVIFEKKSKNRHFRHFFTLYGWTKKDFDMRFFVDGQKWSLLHSDQVLAKSLEPFLRKSRKTAILTTFLYFMDEPDFFSKIRPCHISYFIDI